MIIVITSYSIHYTKLYDGTSLLARPGGISVFDEDFVLVQAHQRFQFLFNPEKKIRLLPEIGRIFHIGTGQRNNLL